MRTTFRIFAAAAVAALGILTSCQQQGLDKSDADGLAGKELVPVTLTASFFQTKVGYTETPAKNLKPAWETDDKVIGFDENNNNYEFTVASVAADGSATLTGEAPANCTLHLIYLCGAGKDDITSGSLSVNYDGQAGDDTIPAVMLADGNVFFGTGEFHFSNAGAVIGINAVKGVPNGSTISKATVFGDNLSVATIALSGSTLALTAGGSTEEFISTGTLTGVTVTDEAGTLSEPVLIAVPAGAKVSAVSVEVESDSYSYNLSTPATLVANQYSYVTGKTFKKKIIEVSFSASCIKPTPESPQPEFVGGEVIKVSNGTDTQDCTVTVEDGVAGITTSLTGPLTMVYPAAAAKMNGNAIEGVLVPTVQDGSFASANICKAEISAGATSATFANQTAVFCITPGAGASTKYVEVITAGAEIANSVPAGSEYDTKHKIHVASASAAPVYVSILVPEGLRIRDLSFADGSNMKTLKDDTDAIAVNSLYTVTNENWSRPYVDLQMTFGYKTKTYKWATMNIGATKPEEYGLYFAWGDVTGQTPSGSTFSTSFDWAHAPFNNGESSCDASYFASVKDTECPNGILALKNDAANVNWGGSWRMPTDAEFIALVSVYIKKVCENHGFTVGTTPNTFFLPAAGCGKDTGFVNPAVRNGHYWSSSLQTGSSRYAHCLYFDGGNFHTSSVDRYYGHCVRAVSE